MCRREPSCLYLVDANFLDETEAGGGVDVRQPCSLTEAA